MANKQYNTILIHKPNQCIRVAYFQQNSYKSSGLYHIAISLSQSFMKAINQKRHYNVINQPTRKKSNVGY